MNKDRTFPTLTAVRGIGAVMVVGTHSAFNTGQILRGWSGGILARLDFGVTIFFILSGFLLTRPFLLAVARGTHHPSVRHYLWKRALRILPLYWVVVVVALRFDPANQGLGWEVWVRNLTLTQLYFPTLLPEALTQMWSLCTEVAFYVALPLICWLVTWTPKGHRLALRQLWWRCSVIAVGGIAWQASWAPVPGREGHMLQWLPGYLPWFMAGMAFAGVSAYFAEHPRDHMLDRLGRDLVGCWMLATAIYAIAWTHLAGPYTLAAPTPWEAGIKDTLYTLAGAFYLLPLVFGPETEGPVRQFLMRPIPVWLGDISYGVYAIHLYVMGELFRRLDITPFTGNFFTILTADLVLTCAAATVSYRFFERPILRFKNPGWAMRLEPRRVRTDQLKKEEDLAPLW